MVVYPKPPELISCADPTADWPLAFARVRFLRILDEEEPDVRQQLQAEVWPVFSETIARLREARDATVANGEPYAYALPVLIQGLDVQADLEAVTWFHEARVAGDPEVASLAEFLGRWSQRWALGADWVVDAALRTLLAWIIAPEFAEDDWVVFMTPWLSALSEEEQRFTFEYPGLWDPTTEPASQARRRLERAFRAHAYRWFAERTSLARARGFEELARPRAEAEHLRWLARYQVVGESFTAIARRDGLADPRVSGRKTVEAAVKKAAARIGLPLRNP